MLKIFDINKFNLDKILWFLFGDDIFTNLDNIGDRKTIDVRSYGEYSTSPILSYNVPVINQAEHDFLHRHLYLAFIVILQGFIKNRKNIKASLIKISGNKKYKLLIACSKGRVRSPIVWMYARLLGINAKILKDGIMPYTVEIRHKKISGD